MSQHTEIDGSMATPHPKTTGMPVWAWITIGLGGLFMIVVVGFVVFLVSTKLLAADGPESFKFSDEWGSSIAITWVDDGDGNLTGSLTMLDEGSPDAITAACTGTLHDGQIAFVFPMLFTGPETWVGTLDGDTLTLEMPTETGSPTPVVLSRVIEPAPES